MKQEITISAITNTLQRQRRDLGMTYAALSKRCNLSTITVQRALSGEGGVSLAGVIGIADALGVELGCKPPTNAREMRIERARRKAEHFVALSQGTSGLEAQGVSSKALKAMTNELTDQLAVGSGARLWSE